MQSVRQDPDIFLREMIQNAHDSIGRRAMLAGVGTTIILHVRSEHRRYLERPGFRVNIQSCHGPAWF